MTSNLIIPRCEVFWGSDNLTLYNLPGSQEGQPLVFNIEVDLQDTGNSPTGSFNWNPTGPAMAVYEKFVGDSDKMKEQIVIRFFYANGKSIGFKYVWSGQEINYGVDMSVTVKLRSELDGVVNAGLRSYAQAYDKPADVQSAISKLEKQFGVDSYGLVKYTSQANEDLKKAKVENAYASDIVFSSALSNLIKANGNIPFASNIDQAGIVLFTPYSWEKNPEVTNAADVPPQQSPDPTKRYGYLLGPAIIASISRSSEWQPPQQTNVNSPLSSPIPQAKEETSNQNPEVTPEKNAKDTAKKKTSAPTNTSNGRSTPTVKMTDNEDGPKKQELLNKEKQSKLQADMFICPVLLGIKPHDIVFVPSLSGNYIEDWVVESVSYAYKSGSATVNIQATRPYGLGNAMQEKVAKEFQTFAENQGLVGANATLEAWTAYAWPNSLR